MADFHGSRGNRQLIKSSELGYVTILNCSGFQQLITKYIAA